MNVYVIAILTKTRQKKPHYQYLNEYKYQDKDDAINKVKELSKGSKAKYVVCRMFEYN